MQYKIAQLTLTSGKNAASTSDIFVAQPENEKEVLAGRLFFLVEINSRGADNLKIINFLAGELEHNYYQNEKMILRERVKTIKIEHIFEAALAKTNKNFAEFLRAEKIKLDRALVSATVGVIYENSIYFSNIGKNKAFLIYPAPENRGLKPMNEGLKTRDGKLNAANASPRYGVYKDKTGADGQKKYKIVDVGGEESKGAPPQAEKTGTPNKLFSNVISGAIPAGGYFLFANEALPEYLSGKQLAEIIAALPPASAAEQIRNMLTRINSYVTFLGLIIKNSAGIAETEIKKTIPASVQASISSLNAMEEKTEKLLAPGGYVNIRKWLAPPLAILAKLNPLARQGKNNTGAGYLQDKIFFKKKGSFIPAAVVKITQSLKNLFLAAINSIAGMSKIFFKLATERDQRAEAINKIKNAVLRAAAKAKNLYGWFKNLDKKNKILFAVSLAAIILLVANLLMTGAKNKRMEEEKSIAELMMIIDQKQNQVEASLLYKNEAGAKNLLDEIDILLAQLPRKENGYEEKYAPLFEKYYRYLEEIKHVIASNPEELFNFSSLSADAAPENIALANAKVYAADAKKKEIYSFDLDKKTSATIPADKEKTTALKYPYPDKERNFYYFAMNGVVRLDAGGAIKTFGIESAGTADKVSALALFNNKLYLLHNDLGQIYTYRKEGDKFIGGSSWIKEKTDLNNAISMDIDGAIYILKNDGQLLKFLKGGLDDFSLAAVEPALERPVKTTAKSESNYIYILEPVNKRLVVFDKEGKFILQYRMENLSNLKDFAIDEAEKIIYFLNNSSLYKIEAKHLK